ncbi:MAG: N-acetylmuramoyl-L-alanine amidase [Pseudomonadota bacterium]
MNIRWRPSPNFGPRPDGVEPSLVVLHYTAMDGSAAALDRLCAAECGVSAHYLVSESGGVTQLVDEACRAWHAGAGAWGAIGDVNAHSIGIELANRGDHPFAAAQMSALEDLLSDVLNRRSIAPERVIGHSDMAPGRKIDPGPRFDWARLARRGLSVWPAAAEGGGQPADEAGFQAALGAFGYPAAAPARRREVFRVRFRPWASGPTDGTDLARARELARRFPVDQGRARA